MKRLLIAGAVVAAVAVAVVLGVTLGGGGGGGGGGTSTAAAPQPRGDAVVSVRELGDAGNVLVDRSGQALYASDEESSGGMVLCTDACTSFWTPLTVSVGVPASNELAGELGTVTRPDGARQVTYDGKLLYSFSLDDEGQVTGDGFSDAFDGQQLTWHVVHGDGSTGSGSRGTTGIPGY
jgi:predicted lipoprotein with Yx(FWY)xxD motif